jgi:hypothetical protein
MDRASDMKYIGYKNPAGYVIGYICSDYGTDMNIDNLKSLYSGKPAKRGIIKRIKEELTTFDVLYNLKLEDIIRYMHFWTKKIEL